MMHQPATIALLILLINLPFGYWRAGVPRLSPAWFLAIHLPVILAIGIRILLGMGFRLVTLPLYVAAFAGGQWLGGRGRPGAAGPA
jgi:hypothetical protein